MCQRTPPRCSAASSSAASGNGGVDGGAAGSVSRAGRLGGPSADSRRPPDVADSLRLSADELDAARSEQRRLARRRAAEEVVAEEDAARAVATPITNTAQNAREVNTNFSTVLPGASVVTAATTTTTTTAVAATASTAVEMNAKESSAVSHGVTASEASNTAITEDDATIQSAWTRKGHANALSRTFEIWRFFFACVAGESRIRKLRDPAKIAERRIIQAKKMKTGLLSLGPTFIKLGQLMSTRVDVVPKEYIDEFASLQDRVPCFSGARAVEVIEAEFGRPISEIYDSFDPVPIAAASLGQVHRACLNGREVAVKIQRAGLRELFDVDLKNLKLLARMLDRLDPKNDGAKRNWVSIYEESAKLLYEEIDYVLEAQNADRFRKNFENIPWIKVPDVYWDQTSSRVLTMEYVPGIKINDYEAIEAAGIDRRLLARRSAESYLTQLLRHGYFHTDPHCGNISCDAVAGGRLIVYDYGMMSAFPAHIKQGLVDVIFGIYEGSASEICDAMVSMGVLSNTADRVTVEKVGRYFLGLFRTNLENDNRRKSKEEKRVEMIRRLDFIGEDLLALSEDECFSFPPVFTFVFRSFATLEGIGKGLDPSYDLTKIAGPYLKELIDLKDGSAAITAMKAFRKKVGWRGEDIKAVVTAPRKTAYIEETLRRMESGDLRLRVRVLESERSFKRMSLMQENMALALAAATFSNMACVLMSRAEKYALQAKLVWIVAGIFAVRLAIGLLKFRAMEQRMNRFTKSKNSF